MQQRATHDAVFINRALSFAGQSPTVRQPLFVVQTERGVGVSYIKN
jgi:hypothetical protein